MICKFLLHGLWSPSETHEEAILGEMNFARTFSFLELNQNTRQAQYYGAKDMPKAARGWKYLPVTLGHDSGTVPS